MRNENGKKQQLVSERFGRISRTTPLSKPLPIVYHLLQSPEPNRLWALDYGPISSSKITKPQKSSLLYVYYLVL